MLARQPFSLTYVTYVPGDKLGLICSILALAPVFIVVSYATLLISRREAHLAYVLCGQLLNVGLNAVLKSVIGEPRPPGADHDGNGMPSDHAQFMSFWACYGVLFLAHHVPCLGRTGWRPVLATAMSALSLAVAFSRVYLGYHTIVQVLVGFGIGSSVACVWHGIYSAVLRPRLGTWVGESAICRYMLVRDCAHIEDVITFEFEAVMHAHKRR